MATYTEYLRDLYPPFNDWEKLIPKGKKTRYRHPYIPDLIFEGLIGQGAYSKVFRYRRESDDQLFAVKVTEFTPPFFHRKEWRERTKYILDGVLNEIKVCTSVSEKEKNTTRIHQLEKFYPDFNEISKYFQMVENNSMPSSTFEIITISKIAVPLESYLNYLSKNKDLHRKLQPGSPHAEANAAAIALDLLHCVKEAYSRGFLHHDQKISNYLLDYLDDKPHIVMTDFNISIRFDPRTGVIEHYPLYMGTPNMMHPEQKNAKPGERITITPEDAVRYELYQVGLVIYRILNQGRIPTDKEIRERAIFSLATPSKQFETALNYLLNPKSSKIPTIGEAIEMFEEFINPSDRTISYPKVKTDLFNDDTKIFTKNRKNSRNNDSQKTRNYF